MALNSWTWIDEPADAGGLAGALLLPGRVRLTAAGLGLIAFILYAPLVGWGLPHATAPDRIKTFATDEILPLEGLAEMRSTFVSTAPDRQIGYPWWHYFVVSAAQLPYVAGLMLSGDLAQPSPVYPFGLRDPVRALKVLTVIGRMVSVLMGAGIVLASFFFARALWDHATGMVAGVLTMLSYPMFYYSRTANMDVPAFFWSAIGLAILATMLSSGVTTRRAVWLGLFTALAGATKDQAVALFIPLCLALLLPRFNHPPGTRYQVRPLMLGLGVGLIAYVAATGMLVDPHRHLMHLHAQLFDQGRVTGASAYFPSGPRTWENTAQLAIGFGAGLGAMMSWPVLLMSAAGCALAARRARWHLLWLLPFVTIFVLFVRIPGIIVVRYFLPLTLFVDAFAALALTTLWRSRGRAAFVPLLVVLVSSRVAMGLDLSYAQLRDTRYAAADWLRAHYRAGDRVEYFGVTETLPPLEGNVSSRRIMGREDWVGERGHGQAVLEYLAREGPKYVIVIPDWTSRAGMEHSGDCPPEVYAALLDGTAGYSLTAYFAPPSLLPDALRRPPLDNPSVAPPVRIFLRKEAGDGR
ncbi:MAG TPA: glycosyltransferase family 39 protein [Vicinamibacterales bacterium]|nr:glycosyltransferase family 39 protein [Vicinamibacterales bacterium]